MKSRMEKVAEDVALAALRSAGTAPDPFDLLNRNGEISRAWSICARHSLNTTAADGRLGCWTVLKSQRLATANVLDPN